MTRTIPQDMGLPLIGKIIAFDRDIVGAMQQTQEQFGDVVRLRFGPETTIMLFGPDSLEWGFRNTRDLSNRLGWQRYLDHVFPGALLSMDGQEHLLNRRIMQTAFSKSALRDYTDAMNRSIARQLPEFVHGHTTYLLLKKLLLTVAGEVFMDVDDPATMAPLNKAFIDTVEASIALLRIPGIPSKYTRGRRGRKVLVRHFQNSIEHKRQKPGTDLFSYMCQATSEEGEAFEDSQIINHMIFLMMAAHDTSTSTLSTLLYHLAIDPTWQQQLREISMELDDALSMEQLESMDVHRACIDESLRVHPPLPMMPRTTVAACEFAGFELPEGTLVSLTPVHTHYMESIYTDPKRFDPLRFLGDRQEHKAHRFAFAPFGGGAHLCMGKRFAYLEITSVLHQLLKHYRWSAEPGYTMPYQFTPIAKPKDGLPMHFERL